MERMDIDGEDAVARECTNSEKCSDSSNINRNTPISVSFQTDEPNSHVECAYFDLSTDHAKSQNQDAKTVSISMDYESEVGDTVNICKPHLDTRDTELKFVKDDAKMWIQAKNTKPQEKSLQISGEIGDKTVQNPLELKRSASNDNDGLPYTRSGNSETNYIETTATLPIGDRVVKMDSNNDCEKENRNITGAMDLSSFEGNKRDVITLSDSDDDLMRIHYMKSELELNEPEFSARCNHIRLLQSQLRNEETKLVLLKKLRNSQMSTYFNNSNEEGHVLSAKTQNFSLHQPRLHQPPPLIRGQSTLSAGTNKQMISYRMPNSRTTNHHPPPLVMAPRNHATTAPSSKEGMNMRPNQLTETPTQRQAAAKLALRKQLEKTLLQIPPPKPPPPEMNFIPSFAGAEFIILIGLEEVVNHITDASLIARGRKNPNERLVCTPFTCVQCCTDYTPVWKREKPGSKNVICELCVTTNQKKALKHEHTNRLKSAFVKALQQEQEIERMQANASPPSNTAITVASTTSYKNNEQIRQNYMTAHPLQAHMRSSPQPLNLQSYSAPSRTFPFQLNVTTGQQKQTDLQRQYLLDMIPARSMQQGGLQWKSSS